MLLLLNPFAPHMTEEIWQAQNFGGMLHQQSWPQYDEAKCVDCLLYTSSHRGKALRSLQKMLKEKLGESSYADK